MSGLGRVVGIALAPLAATLALLVATPATGAAAAQDEVFIEVNPSTIQAGHRVALRAGCGEDRNPAPVSSGAFGEVMLQPRQDSSLLTGAVTIPTSTRPGEYRVELRCADGATATTELFVVDMARPTRGPKTGGGGTAATGTGSGGTAGPALLAGAGLAALAAGAALLLARRRTT